MNNFIQNWIAEISSETDRVNKLFQKLTLEELNAQPAPNKWSIGELVEHLIVSNKLYFSTFKLIANNTHKNPRFISYQFLPRLIGKLVLQSITPITKRKFKTVEVFKPKT